MAGTRSSARLASQPKSSPTRSNESPKESPKVAAGSKRKAEVGSSPTAKRGRKTSEKKEQKTIEETMDIDETENSQMDTAENGDASQTEQPPAPKESEKPEQSQVESNAKDKKEDQTTDPNPSEENGEKQSEHIPSTNGNKTETKASNQSPVETSKMDDTGKIEPNGPSKSETQDEPDVQNKSVPEPTSEPKSDSKPDSNPEPEKEDHSSNTGESAVQPHARDEDTPSSILEKGIIYFFFRGRVGIENPSDVNDIARSYMVLRPIPHGAKIGDGPIGDGGGKCRLLALPKKVLPLSGKDKFMTFVEKSKTTFKELKDEFMSASDYETQTAGVRHTPAVTPLAEGVYAITTTGRESHLAYMITIPQELGEVQKDIGIREQGSFITSAKNPKYAGPANTNLPQGPEFPKEILDEFRSLRWAPLQPKFLDYENCQFLLIGESSGLEGASEQKSGDNTSDQNGSKEELEKLEGEDEIRIKHLKGDDTVFSDLGISKKEYPQVPSTWSD